MLSVWFENLTNLDLYGFVPVDSDQGAFLVTWIIFNPSMNQ